MTAAVGAGIATDADEAVAAAAALRRWRRNL